MDNEEADNLPEPQRRGPWPLMAVVVVATLVAIYLIPGEESPPPQADYRPKVTPVETGTKAQAPSLLPPGGQATVDSTRVAPEPASASASAAAAAAPEAASASTPAEPLADTGATMDSGQAAPASSPPASAATESAAPVEPLAPGGAARALIARLRGSSPVDTAQALAAARDFHARGEKANAYLMYFFAAREGDAEAALAFGRQADPGLHDPDSVFDEPRPDQAYKWYKQAVDAGNTAAAPLLQALKQRLETAAASGDDQARRLTLFWQ